MKHAEALIFLTENNLVDVTTSDMGMHIALTWVAVYSGVYTAENIAVKMRESSFEDASSVTTYLIQHAGTDTDSYARFARVVTESIFDQHPELVMPGMSIHSAGILMTMAVRRLAEEAAEVLRARVGANN